MCVGAACGHLIAAFLRTMQDVFARCFSVHVPIIIYNSATYVGILLAPQCNTILIYVVFKRIFVSDNLDVVHDSSDAPPQTFYGFG